MTRTVAWGSASRSAMTIAAEVQLFAHKEIWLPVGAEREEIGRSPARDATAEPITHRPHVPLDIDCRQRKALRGEADIRSCHEGGEPKGLDLRDHPGPTRKGDRVAHSLRRAGDRDERLQVTATPANVKRMRIVPHYASLLADAAASWAPAPGLCAFEREPSLSLALEEIDVGVPERRPTWIPEARIDGVKNEAEQLAVTDHDRKAIPSLEDGLDGCPTPRERLSPRLASGNPDVGVLERAPDGVAPRVDRCR